MALSLVPSTSSQVDRERNDHGGQVDDAAGIRPGYQRWGQLHAQEIVQHAHHVAGPADRHGRSRHGIFQHPAPSRRSRRGSHRMWHSCRCRRCPTPAPSRPVRHSRARRGRRPAPTARSLINMPGPASCAASAVSTKMPVPMMPPMPSMVSWNAPSERVSDFFSAVARIESSDFTRHLFKQFPLGCSAGTTPGCNPRRTSASVMGLSCPAMVGAVKVAERRTLRRTARQVM